jgi:hypothetical protein
MSKVIMLTLLCLCLYAPNNFAESQAPNQESNQPAYLKPITPDKLKEDLDFLFKTIEEVHPNMHAYTSKEEFETLRDELYKSINRPTSAYEFYKLAAPVVASLKNFHILLLPFFEEYKQYAKNGGKVFPLELAWDETKVLLFKNYSSVYLPAGGTVLSINGSPARGLIANFSRLVAAENKNANPWFIENPVFLRSLLRHEFGQVKSWNLKIKTESGTTQDYSVPSLSLNEFKSASSAATAAWKRHCWVRPEYHAAIIKFYKWWEPEELKAFFDSAFSDIHSKKIRNLIIDIRENTGGRDDCFGPLIEHLTAEPYRLYDKVCIKISDQAQERIKHLRANLPDKFENKRNGDIVTIELPFRKPAYNPNRFDGRVFLLIGRRSFSASTVFSAIMKGYKIATLIGEETGDPTTLYADSIMFILPNSQVEAGVASKLLICACGKPDGRGVLPDYEVKQKPEDTARRVDTVLEFTLNLIKNGEAKK